MGLPRAPRFIANDPVTPGSALAALSEPLENVIARTHDGRVAHILGATTRRRYGTVITPLVGHRMVAATNACANIRHPENLPKLVKALNAFFDARAGERQQAIDALWSAAVACGLISED